MSFNRYGSLVEENDEYKQEEKHILQQLKQIELEEKNHRLKKMLQTGKKLYQSLRKETSTQKETIKLLEEENLLLRDSSNLLIDCLQQSLTYQEKNLAESIDNTGYFLNNITPDTLSFYQALDVHTNQLSILKSDISISLQQLKETADNNTLVELDIFKQSDELSLSKKNIREELDFKFQLLNDAITEIKNIFNQAEEGETFEKLVANLQDKISEEQTQNQAMQLKIFDLEKKEENLERDLTPIITQYSVEEAEKAILTDICNHPYSRNFYNTFHKIFSAKINSAILLTSDLIRHNNRTADMVTEFSASLAQNALGSIPIPILGAVLGTIAGTGIKIAGEKIKGKMQADKSKNTGDSIIALDLALKLAAQTALRLTVFYKNKILAAKMPNIIQAAENSANFLYNFVKAGKLLAHKDATIEEKITVLLDKLRQQNIIEEYLIGKKTTDLLEDNDVAYGLEKEEFLNFQNLIRHFQNAKNEQSSAVVTNIHQHFKPNTDTAREAKGKAEFALKHSATTQESVNRVLKNQSFQLTIQQEKIDCLEKENAEQRKAIEGLSEKVSFLSEAVFHQHTPPLSINKIKEKAQRSSSTSSLPNMNTLFSTSPPSKPTTDDQFHRRFSGSNLKNWNPFKKSSIPGVNNSL